MPSMWWDCAPLMAAECLAGRVPVLAPHLGGIPEWVRDEREGLLFDGRSAADLARVIERLASEPGLLERIQETIEPPAPFAAYVDELEAYYRGERPSRGARGELAGPAVRWVGDHTPRRACRSSTARSPPASRTTASSSSASSAPA